MSNFKDLNSLLNAVKKQVKEVAQDEVSKEIKNTMKKHIESDVYNKYTPTYYDRRRENDGLLDESNINVNVKDNGNGVSIVTTNETTGNEAYSTANLVGEYIVETIETGEGYNWKRHPEARPFIENTVKELQDGALEKALKDGLKKRGIDTK